MTRSLAFIRFISMIAAAAGLSAGCSRAGPSSTAGSGANPGNPWSGHEAIAKYAALHGKTVYQVTYQPETVFFDLPSTERALQDISADGTTYTLDASMPGAKQLRAGSVLFLYGVAIRKVTAVHARGSTVVVTTSDGDITDAIRDGQIEWEMPVDYSVAGAPEKAARSRGFDDFFVPPVLALNATSPWKMSFGGNADQFKSTLSFGLDASRLNINIDGTYTGDGAILEYHGQGYVQPVMALGKLAIRGGMIDSFTAGLSGMRGHVAFDWSGVRKDQSVLGALDRNFKIKFPETFQTPFFVGPIPFLVEASAAVIIHPAFTSKNSIASGHYTLDYDGDAGFTTGSSPPQTQGEVHGDAAIGHATVVESLAAAGFTAALELPRFEVSLAVVPPSLTEFSNHLKLKEMGSYVYGRKFLNQEIKDFLSFPVQPYAYVNIVTSTGLFTNGTLTTSLVAMPPCERSQITVTANAGVGAKMNFRNWGAIFSALQPKVEFSVAPPSLKHTIKAWKNHLKCPDD